jgi:pyruvate/2-oxoglutarate dehydrogenase complex dihydrolipoamide acyltransferase (E2) component
MTAMFTMPRMGETMETGRIVAWLKRPGDRFKRGEVLVEIETDKTTVEMPALDDGRLIEILAQAGEEIAVGAPLGRYEADDSHAQAGPPVISKAATPHLQVLTLPRMGETMEQGRIVAWLKQPGQAFKRGEVIVEIETDKTTVEVPALDDGCLVEIVAESGDEVTVGEPIGRYERLDSAAAPVSSAQAPAIRPDTTSAGPAPQSSTDRPADQAPATRPRATPLAR